MIDEAELRDLLEDAAADFEVPADGPGRVLALATTPTEPKRTAPRWRRPRLAIGAAAIVFAVVGIFALGSLVGTRDNTPQFQSVGRPTSPTAGAQGAAAGSPSGSMAVAAPGSVAAPTAAGPGTVNQTSRAAPAPSAAPAPAPDSAKVIKTGSVQIEVRKGAVGDTMTRLTSVATGLGGYVADSQTTEAGDNPTGKVTLRVPAAGFENLVASVRGLGTVKSITTHGQDVTAQYTDIQARLTALDATRNQLLTILSKASAIGDVLAVQDRINDVQTQIEQLQGQLKVLDDQTSFAALSVDVAQHGAAAGSPAPESGLAKAWHDARDGFTNGVETIIAHSGTALLLLLIAAAIAVAVRFSWPRLRRRFV